MPPSTAAIGELASAFSPALGVCVLDSTGSEPSYSPKGSTEHSAGIRHQPYLFPLASSLKVTGQSTWALAHSACATKILSEQPQKDPAASDHISSQPKWSYGALDYGDLWGLLLESWQVFITGLEGGVRVFTLGLTQGARYIQQGVCGIPFILVILISP